MNANGKTQIGNGKSKSVMPSDLVIVLGTAAFAALFGGGMMWALIKENTHPAWFWVILGFSALMFVILTSAFLPSRESKLADRLGASSQAGRATGRVVQMHRLSTRESTLRETRLELTLLLSEADGSERTVSVKVWVEDVMMHNFGTGRVVHVLYDVHDPGKVAIDRSRTPVQMQ